jgi:hypothetical protein
MPEQYVHITVSTGATNALDHALSLLRMHRDFLQESSPQVSALDPMTAVSATDEAIRDLTILSATIKLAEAQGRRAKQDDEQGDE